MSDMNEKCKKKTFAKISVICGIVGVVLNVVGGIMYTAVRISNSTIGQIVNVICNTGLILSNIGVVLSIVSAIRKEKPEQKWACVVYNVLLLGICLTVYAVFHFVTY